MSSEMLSIYCLLLSSETIAAQRLSDPSVRQDYYNAIQAKITEFETIWVPLILLFVFILLVVFLWLICWVCDDLEEEENKPDRPPVPLVSLPIVIENVSHQHMISVQNVSEGAEPKPKEKAPKPKKTWNVFSNQFRKKEVKKQSIRANDSKKASINVKNESHLESNAKNTIGLNQIQVSKTMTSKRLPPV